MTTLNSNMIHKLQSGLFVEYSPSTRHDPGHAGPGQVGTGVGDLAGSLHEAEGGVLEPELVLAVSVVACLINMGKIVRY